MVFVVEIWNNNRVSSGKYVNYKKFIEETDFVPKNATILHLYQRIFSMKKYIAEYNKNMRTIKNAKNFLTTFQPTVHSIIADLLTTD